MRIIAILASYNEQRFMRACLEHYKQQGVEVYLLDNQSTDRTVEIAREYLTENVVGIESIPRHGMYQWRKILLKKEEIGDRLKADWLMHADPDEIRIAPDPAMTLADAFDLVDREGYNAINFMEYTFLPTKESPDHDHPNFQQTMRWYYPFGPRHPHRLNAWKKQGRTWPGLRRIGHEIVHNKRFLTPSVDLHSSGGHIVKFPGIKPYPVDFTLKHYIVLSLDHAVQKYVKKKFDPKEIESSHGWRAKATQADFLLPLESEMRIYTGDRDLDPSNPLKEHLIARGV